MVERLLGEVTPAVDAVNDLQLPVLRPAVAREDPVDEGARFGMETDIDQRRCGQ
jgi:hypothetical protein